MAEEDIDAVGSGAESPCSRGPNSREENTAQAGVVSTRAREKLGTPLVLYPPHNQKGDEQNWWDQNRLH